MIPDLSQLVDHEVLELPVTLLLDIYCIPRFLPLSQLIVDNADMIGDDIHYLPLYLLYLCHVSLILDASVHGFQLFNNKRLQCLHILDKNLGLLDDLRGFRLRD